MTHHGAPLALTIREFDLLAFLLRRPNQVFSREELIKAVWGWDFGDLSTVTVHVRRLREKIEADPTRPGPPQDGVGRGLPAGHSGRGTPVQTSELLAIVAWALLWAVVIGTASLLLLRPLRRTSIAVQICVVVLSTVAVLTAGMVSAFNAMFISARDLEVMWYVLAIASAVAVAISLVLGAGSRATQNCSPPLRGASAAAKRPA